MASVACTDQAACAPVPLRRSGDVTSLILSVAASVGAAVIISFVFAPRLAARAKRIQVSHDARDEFQKRTLGIYTLCVNLQQTSAAGEPARQRFGADTERWSRQIDESTQWLADNWHLVALTYPQRGGLPRLITRYAFAVRAIWLSQERPPDVQLQMLKDLTEPVCRVFATPRKFTHVLRTAADISELRRMLDGLESAEAPPAVQETQSRQGNRNQLPALRSSSRAAAQRAWPAG